jgi:hypothetical protein
MDTERSRRHASKLLTYPLTVGSVLHQNSPLTLSNQRVTPEGSRSLAGNYIVISFDAMISRLTRLGVPSTSEYIACTYGCPRDRRSWRYQATDAAVYSRGACRIVSAAARLGSDVLAIPFRPFPPVLYRPSGFTTEASTSSIKTVSTSAV